MASPPPNGKGKQEEEVEVEEPIGVSEGFYKMQGMSTEKQNELFSAFLKIQEERDAEEEAVEKAALRAGATASEDQDNDDDDDDSVEDADNSEETLVWSTGDIPPTFRSWAETHNDCVERFDDVYPEDAPLREAEKRENELIELTDKWGRYDMITMLSREAPVANSTDHVIPAGMGSTHAVIAVVSGDVDRHGARQEAQARLKEAEDYAESVKHDARAASSMGQLELLQQLFVKRCEIDRNVHKSRKSVKRVVNKLKKQLAEKQAKKLEEAKALHEKGEKDSNADVAEKVREHVKRMTGRVNSPGDKHPELKSVIGKRPVSNVVTFNMSTSVSAHKGTTVVKVTAKPGLRDEFRRVELTMHKDAQMKYSKALRRDHWQSVLVAVCTADASVLMGNDGSREVPRTEAVDRVCQLALNACETATKIPKQAAKLVVALRKYCDAAGIKATVKKSQTLAQLLGEDAGGGGGDIDMDAIRLAVYRLRLVQVARKIDGSAEDVARRAGYEGVEQVLQDADEYLEMAERLLHDKTVGKRWNHERYEPMPELDLDAYQEDDPYSFPAQVYSAKITGNAAAAGMEWEKPTNHAGVVRTTGALAVHGDTLAVGGTRVISLYNVPTGKKSLDVRLDSTWGGRITGLSMNEHFICAIMDYPDRQLTYCSALVYHRESHGVRLFDMDPLQVSTIAPDPADPDVFWIGTDRGIVYGLSWEREDLTPNMHPVFICATQSPVKRISRVGRLIHVLTSTDMFSNDVTPKKGESIPMMVARVGNTRQTRLMFPSDHSRFGLVDFIVDRRYQVLVMIKGGAAAVRSLVPPKELSDQEELEPFVASQFIRYDAEENRLYVMYGSGRVRVMWPGATCSQYERPEMTVERLALKELVESGPVMGPVDNNSIPQGGN